MLIEKIQKIIITALSKTDKLKIRGMPMIMVYLVLFIVIASMLLFLYAWMWQWEETGKADLPVMIQFIIAITSVSFIGAVGFFGRAMIDKDGDDIPDDFENKVEGLINDNRTIGQGNSLGTNQHGSGSSI